MPHTPPRCARIPPFAQPGSAGACVPHAIAHLPGVAADRPATPSSPPKCPQTDPSHLAAARSAVPTTTHDRYTPPLPPTTPTDRPLPTSAHRQPLTPNIPHHSVFSRAHSASFRAPSPPFRVLRAPLPCPPCSRPRSPPHLHPPAHAQTESPAANQK